MNKPLNKKNVRPEPWAVYQDIIARDRHPTPPDLLEAGTDDLGLSNSSREMYTSPAFHKLELDRLWSRVWQFACREEEIESPGDVAVYELGDWSFMIVRAEDNSIKAYYNSCTHRGTKLCSSNTHLQKIRCPYHGFTWNLNGSINKVPSSWDFPHVSEETHSLQEVRVGTWGGFVFINLDPKAPPLEEYLENLPSQLGVVNFKDLYIAGYYRKILPSNWKGSIEAFIESYHTAETHPQTTSFSDEQHTQYDLLGRHTSRFLQALGVASASFGDPQSEQQIVNSMFAEIMREKTEAPPLPDGMTARQFMADTTRTQLTEAGRDVSGMSDAELVDAMQYSLFPNMVLFRSVGFPVVYRFRPNKHDPDTSIFDMFILKPVPAGAPRPLPAEPVEMGDMRYVDIPELSDWLGDVYDQDVANLKLLQEGLKAGNTPVTLSQYQEIRIRHFHNTLRAYLEQA
ncbi:aromatic ring-hydroxylating oxygenase subunit alpha [Noviherbaspirillum sedimenti]|uniref:Aromatic ring-hydroxylating dioxygenase subunit alpha n=1 Tax=Noviherbaspirillum sedimenti TaxID=2320865 RepID=A0A3A3G8X2_9BURK|nr:aromatic ring-hydroxylating dioxygenase subunit alpha [Noviherbaspirillum sedimenti]RJG03199.1 aromatic ring-hydroxylating dioxygenase subunit alpha [Noviherbaspirillum sedimenti]